MNHIHSSGMLMNENPAARFRSRHPSRRVTKAVSQTEASSRPVSALEPERFSLGQAFEIEVP